MTLPPCGHLCCAVLVPEWDRPPCRAQLPPDHPEHVPGFTHDRDPDGECPDCDALTL